MKPALWHPEDLTLALLAGGDLAWSEALAAGWHVCFCPQCKRSLAELRSVRLGLDLASRADLRQPSDAGPDQMDPAWTALEAEMRANIRLGLTAGSLAPGMVEAGEPDPPPQTFVPWRWAVVCGALVFVLAAGWWLRTSAGAPLPLASVPAWEVPAAEQAGQGAGIQMLVPVADVSRTEADFDGSIRSRVIDGETGQVTLQQVYVE